MKKQTICTLLLVLLGVFSLPAQSIAYDYDAAGNRISRTVITIPPPQSGSTNRINPFVENWGERKITIYPNPTKGSLKISITNGALMEAYEAKTFDSDGRLINTTHQTGNGEMVVDLNAQSPGVYILKLSSVTEEKTYKILKEGN
jgi:hypothetical protein